MITKNNSTSEKEGKTGKVKVGKLQRNGEAVTDLTVSEQKQVKGGSERKELKQELREKQARIAEL